MFPAELSVGRPDEAIRVLSQRIHADTSNAEAYSILCRVYYLLDDWELATSNGERAVQLNPRAASYHLWLGRAYGRKAEQANPIMAFVLARRVVREFERAFQLDPGDWPIRRDLAEFYVLAPSIVGGGESKAVRLADAIATSDPTGASLIRSMLAQKKKDWKEVERLNKAAIESSGGAAEPWLDLARLYRDEKRWTEFDEAVQQALASPKKSSEDLFDAGELLADTGRMLPQAAEALRAFLHANGSGEYATTFRAYYLLGQTLEKMGDHAEAIRQYRASLALAGNYRPAQQALHRLGA
jgi:tetratricopeptide (TPR) repeat protein